MFKENVQMMPTLGARRSGSLQLLCACVDLLKGIGGGGENMVVLCCAVL